MSDTPALKAWLTLLRAPGVGPVHGARLLRAFRSPTNALAASAADWSSAGVPAKLCGFDRGSVLAAVDKDLSWLEGDRRELLTIDDARYPERLRDITSSPLALFCEGDIALLTRSQLAIVGARFATPQGRESAAGFASELTRRGLLVTSGLALGVDGAAHQGALDAGGATIAVCGTGLDSVYPSRHRKLAARIAQQGLLVSEYPCGTPPAAANFPRRNRILSGLSLGVLVVEAAMDSGSLVTARYALEHGREVFAIPGSVHNPLSRGPHSLIRMGAKLTESVHDIFEEIGAQVVADVGAELRTQSGFPGLSAVSRKVLEALGHEATSINALVERLSMPVESLNAALMRLELDGHVASVPGGAYQRVTH